MKFQKLTFNTIPDGEHLNQEKTQCVEEFDRAETYITRGLSAYIARGLLEL